ncbi:hypothetical protein ACIBK9_07050 [Nonomuraea sp. NPDC050227]|uniref:hypothetical protein n=1 Tax=Nonomuraea sp. NPDC050227 TaxID=3364360 RepID=UPI0037AEC218
MSGLIIGPVELCGANTGITRLTCGFARLYGSAVLVDQTADGRSSLYSNREIDNLGWIMHRWP